MAAQPHELRTSRADGWPVVAAEVGDGLEVGHQAASEPHQLEITLGLALEPAAGGDAVEVAVDVDLEQGGGMVSWSSRGLGHHAGKAEGRQVQFIDKGFNDAHGIVRRHIVVRNPISVARALTALPVR
jgi:hypothetical protein